MKKAYKKPQIVFDSFELSQSIARCEIASNVVRDVCGYYDEETDMTVFVAGVCEWTPQDSDIYAGICYHVPTETYNLFSS